MMHSTQTSNNEAYTNIYNAAVLYLSRREYARRELQEKLRKKFPSEDLVSLIHQVLEHLVEKNWQSDGRYMQMVFDARIARGYGPLRIIQELKQKGIDKDLAESFVWGSDQDWCTLLSQLNQKKFGSENKQAVVIKSVVIEPVVMQAEQKQLRRKQWQKQMRYLLSRGFTHEQISQVIK